MAVSLFMELQFQGQKGKDWAAVSYLLSADFQLLATQWSGIFSPSTSSSAAYTHSSPVVVFLELVSGLVQGANLTKNDYSFFFLFAGLVYSCTSSLFRLPLQPWESYSQH